MESETTKEVLVKLGERNRVVELPTDYGGVHSEREVLLTEIRRTFANLLSPSDSITLQMCDTSWGNYSWTSLERLSTTELCSSWL